MCWDMALRVRLRAVHFLHFLPGPLQLELGHSPLLSFPSIIVLPVPRLRDVLCRLDFFYHPSFSERP